MAPMVDDDSEISVISQPKKKICHVCKVDNSKYKCPTCKIAYCSLKCYKQHKETPCTKTTHGVSRAPDEPAEQNTSSSSNRLDEDSTVLSEEILARLPQSKDILNSLCNPDLRKILTWINNSKNAHKAIKTAMMEPIFVDFVDECLEIVEENEKIDCKRLKTS